MRLTGRPFVCFRARDKAGADALFEALLLQVPEEVRDALQVLEVVQRLVVADRLVDSLVRNAGRSVVQLLDEEVCLAFGHCAAFALVNEALHMVGAVSLIALTRCDGLHVVANLGSGESGLLQ